jgi:predicted CoA-substrate-specific enzyme activase
LITAGVDVGSSSTKAVIVRDGQVVASSVVSTGADGVEAATLAMHKALEGGGMQRSDLQYVVATGYGRFTVPFAHRNVTEISCHAKGTSWFFPNVRTILDMGGQDCKAIRCDERGRLLNFVLNDKCAAGTGRYLERVARFVQVPLHDIGVRSLRPVREKLTIDSYCTVFAENDVIHLLREGHDVNDILAVAMDAITNRIMSLLGTIDVEEEFSISGGVAKNIGIVRRLEDSLGLTACVAPEPLLVGAFGAALFAREALNKGR